MARAPRDPNAPKQERKPAGPKTVYAVVQVLNEHGEPVAIPKGQVRVISFEKNAESVLAKVESGDYPNALYLRGQIPPGR